MMNKYLNKIINDDCFDLLKELPDNCIDLVVTSPPYDDLRNYNDSSQWNFSIFKAIAQQLNRVLSDGGVIVWIVGDGHIDGQESGSSFKQYLYFGELGLRKHDTMIWNKGGFTFPDSTRYPQCFEYMFILSKGKPRQFAPLRDRKNLNPSVRKKGTTREKDGSLTSRLHLLLEVKETGIRFNVWDIPTEKNNRTGHPAVFPIRLAMDHIETWSNENDIVLDCFSGSGSTALAAHTLNRKFICIEKDKDYWQASVERLKTHQRQMKLI